MGTIDIVQLYELESVQRLCIVRLFSPQRQAPTDVTLVGRVNVVHVARQVADHCHSAILHNIEALLLCLLQLWQPVLCSRAYR